MAEIKRADVLTYLENANMLEVSELINEIEEKFGVTAAAPVAAAAAAAPVAAAAEEKTEFDVVMSSFGEKKKPKSHSQKKVNCPGTQSHCV